ncbi:Protein RETICULATA-RELATED 4, chloroplastic [Coccomyxa sp. Obi]|nr:Protein RETICULATA-RELATED 4, chloroplastic [Coccomyxa sp. Obi]
MYLFLLRAGGGGQARSVAEEDPDDDSVGTTEEILAQADSSLEQLPQDLQDALARGTMSGAELQQWLKLAARPLLGPLCALWPAFRDRVLGNPRFLLVLMVEEVIGCTAKTIAEYRVRKQNFWKEIDFVMSDLSLEIIGDFAIVWLLSPKKTFGAAPTSAIGKIASQLPGHALQIGRFSLAQRLGTMLLRGSQFFAVGCLASGLGHSLTMHLVKQKKAAILALKESDKAKAKKEGTLALLPLLDEEPGKELAPVWDNSIAWGGFMATSANLRYQLVNGIEDRLLASLVPNKLANNALTVLMRFGNTALGSAHWIWCAQKLGLQ